ncbi:hypothetical protein ACIBQ0_23395 [Nocardia nova]
MSNKRITRSGHIAHILIDSQDAPNVEKNDLENRRGSRHRGFKSHTHRR